MRKLFLAVGFPAGSADHGDGSECDAGGSGRCRLSRGCHLRRRRRGCVIVANALTGGLATPVMTIGSGGGVAVWEGGAALWSIVSTAAGAVVGGYFGDWLYHRLGSPGPADRRPGRSD